MARYRLTIVLAIILLSTAVHAGSEAGKVVSVTGRAVAATRDGDIRALGLGAAVNSGETVVTSANSYARLKFIDGASVILRPRTRFHIEHYRLAEAAAENRSFFNLVKGGFRAVTGLIGKRNRQGFRVRTAVATIGIRGTEFSVRSCQGDCGDNQDGDYYQVHDGEIAVETPGGAQAFTAGEFGFVDAVGVQAIIIPPVDADPLTDDPLPPASCE